MQLVLSISLEGLVIFCDALMEHFSWIDSFTDIFYLTENFMLLYLLKIFILSFLFRRIQRFGIVVFVDNF